jgi:hypothetical protein
MVGRGFRIWGRIERTASGFRAIAAALPEEAGTGPALEDMRRAEHSRATLARDALPLLVHAIATAVYSRGDRVTRMDVTSGTA